MAARQDNVYEDDTSEQLPLSEGLRLLVCPKAVACLRLLSPGWLVYQQALRPGSEIANCLGIQSVGESARGKWQMVVGRGTHSHVIQCWAAVTPLPLCALKERTLRANVTLQPGCARNAQKIMWCNH